MVLRPGVAVVVCALLVSRAQAGEALPPVDPSTVPPLVGPFGGLDIPEAVPRASDTAVDPEPDRPRRNLIFVELGGNGLLCTINYDRALTESFTLRLGIGHLTEGAIPVSADQTSAVSRASFGVPLLVNYVRGNARHRLELGAGITIFAAAAGASLVEPVATAVIGYRYVPSEGGFTYRIGFTPLVSTRAVLPWGGLSFGYLF